MAAIAGRAHDLRAQLELETSVSDSIQLQAMAAERDYLLRFSARVSDANQIFGICELADVAIADRLSFDLMFIAVVEPDKKLVSIVYSSIPTTRKTGSCPR